MLREIAYFVVGALALALCIFLLSVLGGFLEPTYDAFDRIAVGFITVVGILVFGTPVWVVLSEIGEWLIGSEPVAGEDTSERKTEKNG